MDLHTVSRRSFSGQVIQQTLFCLFHRYWSLIPQTPPPLTGHHSSRLPLSLTWMDTLVGTLPDTRATHQIRHGITNHWGITL